MASIQDKNSNGSGAAPIYENDKMVFKDGPKSFMINLANGNNVNLDRVNDNANANAHASTSKRMEAIKEEENEVVAEPQVSAEKAAEEEPEEEQEQLILVQTDEQYREVFELLPTEDMLYLVTRNTQLLNIAFEQYCKVENICLYAGSNGTPAEIISRLSWNKPDTDKTKLLNNRVVLETPDRFQIDLEKINNVTVVGTLFDAVHTMEVVVTRFSSNINKKLLQILTDYNRSNLRQVVLIVEDAEEHYHLGNITNLIRTMRQSVDRLQIIHSGIKVKVDIEPWRVVEKISPIEIRKLPKVNNPYVNRSCVLM